ncbi:MAG: phosphomannomutase/phosphoglucomutase [Microgenomates group bacterium]
MKINPNIFKAYDIRGIYPEEINENNFSKIIDAIYLFFKSKIKRDKLQIVLGRDMRLSSPSLYTIAKERLLDLGIDVYDVNLVSTPTFYFAVLNLKADAGIQISASHNPPQYNGIKFVIRENNKIIKIGKTTGMDEVRENALKENQSLNLKNRGQLKKIKDILKKEVAAAFNIFEIKNIKRLKIVADPANAMGALYLDELSSRIPVELIKMNFELDGRFPAHEPNPLIFDNLKDLQKKVLKEKADLGIAPDGDGDRVFFVDENGKVIWSSLISSLIASKLLQKYKKDKIGIDVRYLFNIRSAVEKAGGKVIIGPVGHALISDLMIKNDILFTGESSGHFFFRQFGYAESAVSTILLVLDEISKKNQPISSILKEFKVAFESGERNFVLENKSPKEVMEKIALEYKDNKISWLDGLSVETEDTRFNIRASNTEPLLRLNVESLSHKKMLRLFDKITNKILQMGAKIK